MNNNLTPAIMYLRKSREDIEKEKQTGEDILQAHRERLTEYLTERGISWDERSEVKTGDSIAARPVFQRVLREDFPSGKYKAICVTEISRLGRGDMEDAGRIYKAVIRYNIVIITPHKDFDPRNPADLRQIRFELFLSREEYEMIKDRLWQARDAKAKKGYAPNYIVTLGINQSRGKMFEVPEESRLVKEIFNLRAEGFSYGEIAKMFNARGLKTKRGTKYHSSTISRILHNPRYIGKSYWQGCHYESKGPKIIPLELWNYVHGQIQPARSVQRRAPKEDNPYLVTLYCHECGNRMYGEWVTIRKLLKMGVRRKYSEYGIYVCVGRKKAVRCRHQQRTEYIHRVVYEELKKILREPLIREELISERNKTLDIDTQTLRDRIASTEKQIRQKESFLEKCKNDYKRGELAAVLYSQIHQEAEKESEILKMSLVNLKKKLESASVKIDNPEEIFRRLEVVIVQWETLSNRDKKFIIAAFFNRVEVDKDGRVYLVRNMPYALQPVSGIYADV